MVKRLGILLTALMFFLTQNPYVFSAPSTPEALETKDKANTSSRILPKKIGTVQNHYQAHQGAPSVLLIEDAHNIPEAQRNIENIIHHLIRNNDIDLVALEGASGKLNAQFFQSYPDQKKLRKLIEIYYERGEISGATGAAIFDQSQTPFIGVEDWNLYEAGLESYLRALKDQNKHKKRLLQMKSDLEKRKKASYSENLLALDQTLAKYQTGDLAFGETLEQLAAYKPPKPNSELNTILNELADSTQNNNHFIELKNATRKIMQEHPSEILNEKYQAFLTERITPKAFALYLKSVDPRFTFSPSLQAKALREQQLQRIQGTLLFKEFSSYITEIKETLFENEIQKQIDRESSELELQARLHRLELSPEDWAQVRNHGWQSPVHAIRFYENTEKRDQAFIKNLLREKWQQAIIVAGGFHKQGIIRQLQNHGISYDVIMPNISHIPDETFYQAQMQGKVSWQDSIQIVNGEINLFESFARALRDQLIEDESQIKPWRDQLLRDLASKNKLQHADKHTYLLDELLDNKAEHLITGLQELRNTDSLSHHNILQLFSKAMIPTGLSSAQLFVPGNNSIRADVTGITELQPLAQSEMRIHIPFLTDTIVVKPGEVLEFQYASPFHITYGGLLDHIPFALDEEGKLYNIRKGVSHENKLYDIRYIGDGQIRIENTSLAEHEIGGETKTFNLTLYPAKDLMAQLEASLSQVGDFGEPTDPYKLQRFLARHIHTFVLNEELDLGENREQDALVLTSHLRKRFDDAEHLIDFQPIVDFYLNFWHAFNTTSHISQDYRVMRSFRPAKLDPLFEFISEVLKYDTRKVPPQRVEVWLHGGERTLLANLPVRNHALAEQNHHIKARLLHAGYSLETAFDARRDPDPEEPNTIMIKARPYVRKSELRTLDSNAKAVAIGALNQLELATSPTKQFTTQLRQIVLEDMDTFSHTLRSEARKREAPSSVMVQINPDMVNWAIQLFTSALSDTQQSSFVLAIDSEDADSGLSQALNSTQVQTWVDQLLLTKRTFRNSQLNLKPYKVQTISNARTIRASLSHTNGEVIPLILDSADTDMQQSHAFQVALSETRENETFLREVSRIAQIVSGILASTKMDSAQSLLRSETRKELEAALLRDMIGNFVGDSFIQVTPQGLVIREAKLMQFILTQYQALAEVRKAA